MTPLFELGLSRCDSPSFLFFHKDVIIQVVHRPGALNHGHLLTPLLNRLGHHGLALLHPILGQDRLPPCFLLPHSFPTGVQP